MPREIYFARLQVKSRSLSITSQDPSHAPQVFDGTLFTQLRTLGAGMLKFPLGVAVDGSGRVYVCDYDSSFKAVVVLDGASGARLATVSIPGEPRGVALTRRGAIVVSHYDPNGIAILGP